MTVELNLWQKNTFHIENILCVPVSQLLYFQQPLVEKLHCTKTNMNEFSNALK